MESSLSRAYEDLIEEVGSFLGYGRGVNAGDREWTTDETNRINSCVKSGLAQFYVPPPFDGQESPYDWSFLHPVGTLTLPQGQTTVPLPEDFGGFEGQISLTSTSSQVFYPVNLIGEGQVRQLYSTYPSRTGRPECAALQPVKGTSNLAGQRFNLYFFPTPDAAYTVQFNYYVLPDYLSGAFPYAYGGAAHAETILESCLSIAEQRLDDAATVHTMKFKERLKASVGWDRKNKPQTLGPNRDLSDLRDRFRRQRFFDRGITYQGVQY